MMPKAMHNISMFSGFFSGSNSQGVRPYPIQLPNPDPQIKVDMPQMASTIRIFLKVPSGFFNFKNKMDPTERIMPYAASESIIPKKYKIKRHHQRIRVKCPGSRVGIHIRNRLKWRYKPHCFPLRWEDPHRPPKDLWHQYNARPQPRLPPAQVFLFHNV